VDPLVDPRCLTTTEAVVVDGTNGVCHGTRMDAGQPLDAGALGVVLLALVSLSWFVGRGASRPRAIAFVATLVLAALPGATSLLFVRADRPRNVRRAGREVAAVHDAVRAFATEHGCAEVVLDDCAACAPIVRLALVDRRCDAPAPIELRADSIESGCAEEDGRLVCGIVPHVPELGP
jgi:hypothetical protein